MVRLPLRLIAVALFGAMVLFLVGTRAARMSQGISGALNDPPLAAEAYRPSLQGVDSVLYASSPLSVGQRRELSARLERLSNSLERNGRTRLARYFASEIRMLAQLSRGGRPLEGRALESLRVNWRRIRGSLFEDAPWFRYDEADSLNTRDPAPRVLGAEDLEAVDRIERVLDRLAPLAERGARDVQQLGEPTIDPEWIRDHYPPMVEAWADWSRRWRAELDEIEAEMPDSIGWDGRVEVRFAHEQATRAINALRMVPGVSGRGWSTPFRREWEKQFTDADQRMSKSRYWVEQARRDDPRH